MPGSRGFLSVDRRSSGRPAGAGAAGACFAQSKMYAPNMMAVPRRRGTRAQGQRAARIVRPPSSRFFAKLSAAGRSWKLATLRPLRAFCQDRIRPKYSQRQVSHAGPADEVEISARRAYGQLFVLPRAPPVGEA